MAYGAGYAGGYADEGTLLVALEVDFTLTDTWEDISGYLVEGNVTRGRQRELDRYQAGRATFTLRNELRHFDPTYTAGDYYPDVKPMRPIRCTATYGPTTYPVFRGFIDRWTQNPEGPHTGSTRVEATDAFKVLGKAMLASSAYAQEVLADGPVAWWRLDEAAGSTPANDHVGTRDLAVDDAVVFGVAGLVARDAGSAMEVPYDIDVAGFGGSALTGELTAALSGRPFSVEMVYRAPDESASLKVGLFKQESSTGEGVDIYLAGGWINFECKSADGTFDSIRTVATSGFDDDTVHHLVCTWDTDTSAHIYVDGVDVPNEGPGPDDSTISGSGVFSGAATTVIGEIFKGASTGTAVTLDEVAVYDHVLSGARVLAHYEAVVTPWNNDSPEERLDRVIAAVGYTGATDFDTGESVLQPAELDMPALEHAQKVAESEMGALYVEADGTLRFKGRTALVNTVSVATFTDATGSDPAIAIYQPEYGDDLIRNDVTVSRLDGVAQNVRDEDSITEYLVNSYTLDGLYHDDDSLSRHMAELIVSEHAEPAQRISGLEVRPYADPATLFPQVLALELTDKVTVEVTPQGVGSEVSQATTIEGVDHTFGQERWETRLTLSPALGGAGCFMELTTGLCGLDTARLYL